MSRRRMPQAAVAAARRAAASQSAQDVTNYLPRRRVKPATARYYAKAHSEVIAFAAKNCIAHHDQQSRDTMMCQYLHMLFFAGDAIFAAWAALYG